MLRASHAASLIAAIFTASSVLSTIGRAEDAASEQLLDGAEVEIFQNRARES